MMILPSLFGLEEQTGPIKTGLSNTIVNGQLNTDKAALATVMTPSGEGSPGTAPITRTGADSLRVQHCLGIE